MVSILRIPYCRDLALAKGMDAYAIRRQNLQRLRQQVGSVRALADRIGTDPNYISQILSVKIGRNMGHDLARQIENVFKLSDGWMDQQHDLSNETDKDIADILELLKVIPPEQRLSIKALLRSMAPKTHQFMQ